MDSELLESVADPGRHGRLLRLACGVIVAGAASYGFVFGCWRGPAQALFSAAKLPLLFFATVAASGLINTMVAQVLGSGLSSRHVCLCMLIGMAVAAAVLGSLSPAMLLFALQIDSPGPETHLLPADHPRVTELMGVYWALLPAHVAVIGVAGTVGIGHLYRLLRFLTGRAKMACRLLALWMLACGFVGCELSWLLSPFLCKPTQPPHVVAREYFEQNFYERVWQALREARERGI
jgi:hypothetical protein